MVRQSLLHPEEIKAAIRIKFGSLSAFEAEKGLPSGSAKDVLRGRSVQRTAEAIALEMGHDVDDLFPRASTKADDATGKPRPQRLNSDAV